MAQTNRPDAGRPDPDALLGAFRRETAGRLKVFLGAAPGVGKTYAMLQNARRLKEEGVDVVIGFVETHGRAETSALVQGLEVLARRRIEYRGRTLEEFDLDAALKRKPKLIVVDELAHTNAPDSRHPKRWQDVQELLDAGVNVWTALNIQHLEKSRRRCLSHHRRRNPRDRSRPGLAGGRRRCSRRSHAGRAHSASERR